MSQITLNHTQIESFKKQIDQTIKNVVGSLIKEDDASQREREKKEEEKNQLEYYRKFFKIKVLNDDHGPLKRKLKRSYIKKQNELIKRIKTEHKQKIKDLKNDLINECNQQENYYVELLQEKNKVKLAEHKQAIYDAFIKKVSTRSYAQFLKNVVYKTFYTTLTFTMNTPWQKQFLSGNNTLFQNLSNNSIKPTVIWANKATNTEISNEFIIFYSRFIPWNPNNKKYFKEVVTKINTQVGLVNYISTEYSSLKILRDVLYAHNRNTVSNMPIGWFNNTKGDRYKYIQAIKQEDEDEDEEDNDYNDDETDIHDTQRTFRRTQRHLDNLIHTTFWPVNNAPFLARTYLYVDNMNDPMTYLALKESSYDLVYNLYLEFILLVLIFELKRKFSSALNCSAFDDILEEYSDLDNKSSCPYNISQIVPGLIILILIYHAHHKKKKDSNGELNDNVEVLYLFQYNTNKIKGREQVRRYIVKLSLLMIKLVIQVLNELEQFYNTFMDCLGNNRLMRYGISN